MNDVILSSKSRNTAKPTYLEHPSRDFVSTQLMWLKLGFDRSCEVERDVHQRRNRRGILEKELHKASGHRAAMKPFFARRVINDVTERYLKV